MSDSTGIAAAALAAALKADEPSKGGTFWVDSDDLRATRIDGTFDLHAIVTAMASAGAPPMGEPLVLAFIQIADEDFLCGIGTSREKAYEAIFEDKDIHPSHRHQTVSYLALTPRSTGWSTDTNQNMG